MLHFIHFDERLRCVTRYLLLWVVVACFFTGVAQAAQTPASLPSNTVSYLITCDRAPYPGGVSCGQPESLDELFTGEIMDLVFRQSFACDVLDSDLGVYWCGANSALASDPGFLIVYHFTDGTVSRIVYLR